MRVYELAKELGIPTKELVEKIKSYGYEKANLSVLEETDVMDIKDKLNPKPKVEEKKEQNNNHSEEVIAEKLTFKNKNNKPFNKDNREEGKREFNSDRKNNFRNNENGNRERRPFNKDNREEGKREFNSDR
ncbi:MAG: translation initiation factor IF-2 N-terminal domain-containing protein, partial [Streptobacillus sp.]